MLILQKNSEITLKNCEDEPIRFPGNIQPFGFLLGIHSITEKIIYCSQNLEQYTGLLPEKVLSKSFRDVLPENLAAMLQSTPLAEKYSNFFGTFLLSNIEFELFVHKSENLFILEAVLMDHTRDTAYTALQLSSHLLKQMEGETRIQTLCQKVAEQVKMTTGYDRVMIYQFDKDFNGEVFAEAVSNGVESYLGLHYPHTDIPAQARQLYLENVMRLISDVDAPPVPVLTNEVEFADSGKLNMSNLRLRSSSPIHLQYLRNMGVKATFTISLIVNQQLWGMIACHNIIPKHISYQNQLKALLQAQVLSSQISVLGNAENYRESKQLSTVLDSLKILLEENGQFLENDFERLEDILQTAKASGIAFLTGKQLFWQGIVPEEKNLRQLFTWLILQDTNFLLTQKLSEHFSPADQYSDLASGLIYRRIRTGDSWGHLVWFRKAHIQEVTWAGNPAEAKNLANQLEPRTSFASWKEIKKKESLPWSEPVIQASFEFAYMVEQHMIKKYQQSEKEKYLLLSERLIKANQELENINYISSHDLKEPLRKIQVFASMIEEQSDTDLGRTITLAVDRIQKSAIRMQRLIDDLLVYSKMSSIDAIDTKIDLEDIISRQLENYDEEKNLFELNISNLPIVKGNPFQLQMLFANLFSNALKFRKSNEKLRIDIEGGLIERSLATNNLKLWQKIVFKDNGRGFDPIFSESIFNMFKRVHSDTNLEGTGIGLAICKKIMENHGGYIRATSEIGTGSSFHLYFPIIA